MPTFELIGVPPSVYVRAAALALEEKGANYRLRAMAPGESKTPEYLKLNPFGRIPVLSHGDFTLYETQAIMRYADEILPGPSLVPADPKGRARMNQACGIADCYVMPQMTMAIAFQRLVAPQIGIPIDEGSLGAALQPSRICVSEIARLLGEKRFLCGDALSIADLLLGAHLTFFALAPEGQVMLAPFESLTGWLGRLMARQSFQNTTPEMLAQRAAA